MLLAMNLGLRFLLELCALATLGYWGFQMEKGWSMRFAAGIGAPLLAAVVWGLFVSPKASVPLPALLRLIPELAVFGAAAAALHAAGRPVPAWMLLAAWAVNKLALYGLERA